MLIRQTLDFILNINVYSVLLLVLMFQSITEGYLKDEIVSMNKKSLRKYLFCFQIPSAKAKVHASKQEKVSLQFCTLSVLMSHRI